MKHKKKIVTLISLLTAISLLIVGCAGEKQENDGTAEAFTPTGEISAESVAIDLTTDDGGYYGFMSDVEVSFGDSGEIQYIIVDDPTLLYFQVSDRYPGGAYIMNVEEADAIKSAITAVIEATDNAEISDKLKEALEILDYSGPIEGAST